MHKSLEKKWYKKIKKTYKNAQPKLKHDKTLTFATA